MKDKLTKRNLKSKDYFMRKLGVIGLGLSFIALVCLLPINISITRQNVALNNEIDILENKIEELTSFEIRDLEMKDVFSEINKLIIR